MIFLLQVLEGEMTNKIIEIFKNHLSLYSEYSNIQTCIKQMSGAVILALKDDI